MRQQSVRKETFDEVPHSPLVYTLAVFKASNDTGVLLHLNIVIYTHSIEWIDSGQRAN